LGGAHKRLIDTSQSRRGRAAMTKVRCSNGWSAKTNGWYSLSFGKHRYTGQRGAEVNCYNLTVRNFLRITQQLKRSASRTLSKLKNLKPDFLIPKVYATM
jgi:hypothetical protein